MSSVPDLRARLADLEAAHKAAHASTVEARDQRDRAVWDALDAGWTQRQVAHAMGVSAGLVGRIAMRRG